MTAHLHSDARSRLASWVPSSTGQAALRTSYLEFLNAHPDACERTCTPGHLTASAIVFDAELRSVALVLHGIVGAWLQPGGHLEASDRSILDAARREVREELGIEVDLDPNPVTLDVHRITCRGYTQPTRHFDVRFVGRALPDATLQCSDESVRVQWWPVDALPDVFDEVRTLITEGLGRLAP